MSILGAIGAVATSLAGSALGHYLGHKENQSSQDYASHATKKSVQYAKQLASWQATELPALQVQGLESAGLNPMLAYGNIGSASMPSVGTQSPAHEAVGSNISRGLSELPERASALKTAEAQRNVLQSQVAENQQAIRESESRARLNDARYLSELESPKTAQSLRAYRNWLMSGGNFDNRAKNEVSIGIPGFFRYVFSRQDKLPSNTPAKPAVLHDVKPGDPDYIRVKQKEHEQWMKKHGKR